MAPPLMQYNSPSLPSFVESVEAVHPADISQLTPSNPALQFVHEHNPAEPPIVPPLTQ